VKIKSNRQDAKAAKKDKIEFELNRSGAKRERGIRQSE